MLPVVPTDSPAGSCLMSLTPIRLLEGLVTSDVSRWDDMWLASHKAVTECVDDPYRTGGHIHVGVSQP